MSSIIKLFIPLLPQILGLVTPALRRALEDVIKDLYKRARETENPIDDILVGILAALLSIDMD